MVFFKDKAASPYSISSPSEYLSTKAITRRTKQGISVSELDLPVNPSYVKQLKEAGIPLYFTTRWMNGALVQCDEAQISPIKALNFVASVQLVAPNSLLTGARKVSTKISDTTDDAQPAASDKQLEMIGADRMHHDNYNGESITIAIIDAGFPGVDSNIAFKPMISGGRINLSASYDFVLNSSNVFKASDHGAKVLSIIGGSIDDLYTGCAYKAEFQLYITEHDPTEYRIEEYNWLFAAERADSAGVDIISTSLGYNTFDDPSMSYSLADMDGKTTVISKAAKLVADRGVLVVCSAGNEGANSWNTITAPADSEEVIAVGNINSMGIRNPTSSVGPTADGRIKPDLVALGTNVSLIAPNGIIASGNGTSFAAPLVAGLAAGIWQKYPLLTSKELMARLKRTASKYQKADNELGYGIPNYVSFSNYMEAVNQTENFHVWLDNDENAVMVKPRNPEEISSITYQLFSIQGNLIDFGKIEFSWLNPEGAIADTNLTAGIYVLRLQQNGKYFSFKIRKD